MKFFKQVLLIFTAVCILSPINHAVASVAQEQLQTTIDQILDILKDPALKGDENTEKRRTRLKDKISERFDFEKMSKSSVAKNLWKSGTQEEKKEFIKLFSQLLEDTYISKIESYTNEKIVYVKDDVKDKKATIDTKIITDTNEIPINYSLYQAEGNVWKVQNIQVVGLNLVGNYRAQFKSIRTFDKLLETLKKKLE
ncbi:MAG: ABC transporter substrate-binding protein [Proteobacteria bacterium]|nr:ABC transporter substrate-binding protein [Pseudomonadota bacterium]MBU1387623.1 ABC transporter substrate-binding protein [Pseudomonadota bacterium]MBU1544214.1 ABC transporter substrate-binding protein [Pseudomonadota bacterium]MBU2429619.1 ABC transporter substrate-binding protein [Pseudomonadota bacterium]